MKFSKFPGIIICKTLINKTFIKCDYNDIKNKTIFWVSQFHLRNMI